MKERTKAQLIDEIHDLEAERNALKQALES
jgi:hypothetical protein